MAIVKGGVWTNVEDEILKAAVSKYGKNQWARISSLLVRKAPKQCKARWYEWLDPGIKKLEWTREEDEKLLHLAKLLPTQWRTIAPIVGRTSTQCLERYQKLLDDAEAADNYELGLSGPGAESAAPTADSVRRLRPGETDPDPETKPAKPDAIDMDEDEKEMLSEARARLANTQGKKAKRKQREKLLEETKRLSVIQKRRDLKAAGINIKLRHRKKGEMDYNADIPFEHKPALGFYDTTEEAFANEKDRQSVDFRQVEQKRRDEATAMEERKANNKKRESEATTSDVSHASALAKLRQAEQLTKRRRLNLPEPKVSDKGMQQIVKASLASRDSRDIGDSDSAATSGLAADYSISPAEPIRTERIPTSQDTIVLEARNLRALNNTQSSLLGAENGPLHGNSEGTGYAASLPRESSISTTNPLSLSLNDSRVAQNGGLRDALQLNNASNITTADMSTAVSVLQNNPAQSRANRLRAQFAALPTPKNDFELELPEQDEAIASDLSRNFIEDAAVEDARQRAAEAAEAELAFKRQSLVAQKQLPRPSELDAAVINRVMAHLTEAERAEFIKLIRADTSESLSTNAQSGHHASGVTLDNILASRALIKQEAESLGHGMDSDLSHMVSTSDSELDDAALVHSINAKLLEAAAQSTKLEKKMTLVLGGYQKRANLLSSKLIEAGAALQQSYIDLYTFEGLQTQEEIVIQTRPDNLAAEVRRLEQIQKEGQAKYSMLINRKEEIMAKMMAQA